MENKSIAEKIAMGVGVTTVLAAMFGAYCLYGSKNSDKNRKKMKAWMYQAKGEIMEQLENTSDATEEIYNKIVKEVTEKYQALKNIDKKDIDDFIEGFKKHWQQMQNGDCHCDKAHTLQS
jgi:gas vesicle protein